MLVQADLRSGTTHLTCWIEPRAKRGDQVTLKNEPGRWWDVMRVGAPREASGINRGWHNNI
jgi:hypothetical protein